jgi:uncharacterized protein YcbX
MPTLSRITVFPIKSLDGLELPSSEIHSGGALQFDRRWALVDAEGKNIYGGKCQAIHNIRATCDEQCQQVTLGESDRRETFSLAVNTKLESTAGQTALQVGDSVAAIEDTSVVHHG